MENLLEFEDFSNKRINEKSGEPDLESWKSELARYKKEYDKWVGLYTDAKEEGDSAKVKLYGQKADNAQKNVEEVKKEIAKLLKNESAINEKATYHPSKFKFSDAYHTEPVIDTKKFLLAGSESKEGDYILGYKVTCGGGRMVSIMDLGESLFKGKVFKSEDEACKAAESLMKEWDEFLKSKGLK